MKRTLNHSVKRGILRAYNQGVDIELITWLFGVNIHDVINIVYGDKIANIVTDSGHTNNK